MEIKISSYDGNWQIGTIDGIKFSAKVYDEGSPFGINGGRVSKLTITALGVNYDRGWDMRPKTETAKKAVKELLRYFKNSPLRFS